jgi:hypothetical protein
MNISGITRSILAGVSLALFQAAAANAGSIYTPTIFKGDSDQIVCVATNVTAAQIHVVVRIFGFGANATTTCDVDPNDPGGCEAFRNADGGYCRITVAAMSNAQVAASLRGILFARKTTAPFAVSQIVQAQ